MRIILYLFAAAFILPVAISCKQKPEKETAQEKYKTPVDSSVQNTGDATQPKSAETIEQKPAESTTIHLPTNATTIWQRIQAYVNTSPKQQDPVLTEVMATMGKDWHYTITQLWFLVQFNIKKKISKGITGLTAANFDDKYDEQYDIAIRGGY